ncbi:hypothetical protein HF313_14255 [Massilia atriviolacea]|uniref:Uncharacterized protein n=1 Tax=Massilia atriviolacea TaxID=2495579 RepID=A0A430HQU5_9BURK|nr:hypothetical protein [Massilia atriviolacea]RSZ59887.1 hypothetical protein EJB06_06790 [Massilia atriviolacea]
MTSIESTSAVLNEGMHRFDQLPGASASIIADAALSDIRLRPTSANFLFFGWIGMAGAVALVVGAVTMAQVLPAWLARSGIVVSRDALLVPVLIGVIAGAWIATIRYARWQTERRLAALSAPQQRAREAVAALRASLPPELSLLGQNLQSASERMLKVYATGNAGLGHRLSSTLHDVFSSAAFVALGAASPVLDRRLEELREALAVLVHARERAA